MSNGKYKGEATVIFQALNAAGCLFWNLERNAELPYDESVIYVAKKLRDKARLSIEPIMVRTRIRQLFDLAHIMLCLLMEHLYFHY